MNLFFWDMKRLWGLLFSVPVHLNVLDAETKMTGEAPTKKRQNLPGSFQQHVRQKLIACCYRRELRRASSKKRDSGILSLECLVLCHVAGSVNTVHNQAEWIWLTYTHCRSVKFQSRVILPCAPPSRRTEQTLAYHARLCVGSIRRNGGAHCRII